MTVRFKDYYELLGVDRTATTDEIRSAYRDLARKYHPDVSKEPGAEERFKEISEAYDVLEDTEKRERYDALGTDYHHGQDFQPPPGSGGFHFEFDGGQGVPGGFSEFFASLFGDRFGGSQGAQFDFRGSRRRRGRDAEARIRLTLGEIAHGGTRSITLTDSATGAQRSYDVRIPFGVSDGTKIRLQGQGDPGPGGGPAGDLLLVVELVPDPRFRVAGSDLRTRVDVAPWEAALGAKVDVAALTGTVSVTVPPGSQSGNVLRLRGLGLPKSADQKGDLLVELRIVVPETLNETERQLFERLRDESGFEPRGE